MASTEASAASGAFDGGLQEMRASLIVNADDYGYYACVSRGILEAASRGIVTATGIFGNAPHFDEQVAWLDEHPTLDLGVHLNLTDRTPLTRGMKDRLARWGGCFPAKFVMARAVVFGQISVADVATEWRAQIERCLAAGLAIRFLNSHEHLHMLPSLFPLTHDLAREYGIAHVRFPTSELFRSWSLGSLVRDSAMKVLAALNRRRLTPPAVQFLGMGESGRLSLGYLKSVIPRLQPGRVYELMCHPGHHDPAEVSDPRLLAYHGWEGELALLTSPEVEDLLSRYGVRLVGYRHLGTPRGEPAARGDGR